MYPSLLAVTTASCASSAPRRRGSRSPRATRRPYLSTSGASGTKPGIQTQTSCPSANVRYFALYLHYKLNYLKNKYIFAATHCYQPLVPPPDSNLELKDYNDGDIFEPGANISYGCKDGKKFSGDFDKDTLEVTCKRPEEWVEPHDWGQCVESELCTKLGFKRYPNLIIRENVIFCEGILEN